jgi:hypothetical protein
LLKAVLLKEPLFDDPLLAPGLPLLSFAKGRFALLLPAPLGALFLRLLSDVFFVEIRLSLLGLAVLGLTSAWLSFVFADEVLFFDRLSVVLFCDWLIGLLL